jgi:bifunctional UDP-N-acetylglucosamine pyrophosphorylase / glucosamine-1-phosphate N-acetyltransferase
MTTTAIVLAAGEGTRMRSSRPKPVHLICGRPMVLHVIHALESLGVERTVVVVGHGADVVSAKVADQAPVWANVDFVEQTVQRGTGDAVLVGLSVFDDEGDHPATAPDGHVDTVVVLPGDTPLLASETLAELVAVHAASGCAATVLTTRLDDPTGYGRIVRANDGRVVSIVEERDATLEQRSIDEVNTGIYAFRRELLGPALRRTSPDNAQSEYYLTDVVSVLAGMGHRVGSVEAPPTETVGVNDRWQLALAERELRARTNRRWLLAGVTMIDPRQTFVDVTVDIGRDVTLFPGTMLQGTTSIGDGCEIGPHTRLVDTTVGAGSVVEQTVARSAFIGDDAHVGPFAHLPAGSTVVSGHDTGAFYTP